MLNPEKIKEKEFQTTGRGSYRSDDVDSFLAEVSSSYDQMYKENGELVKKISILANKVEEYKKDENSLKEALLAAQKLADKIVNDAKEKSKSDVAAAEEVVSKKMSNVKNEASNIMADAKNKADDIIIDAKKQAEEILGTVNRKVTQESLAFDMLQKESSDFRSKLISMYKEHLSLINELPAIAEEKLASLEKAEEVNKTAEPVTEPKAETVEAEPEKEDDESETEAEVIISEPEQEVSEDNTGVEQFSISDIEAVDSFEDISSDSQEDDGFSLDVSDIDLEETVDDHSSSSPADENTDIHSSSAMNYASADDGFKPADDSDAADSNSDDDDDDDDDDEPVSFRSFFKKK